MKSCAVWLGAVHALFSTRARNLIGLCPKGKIGLDAFASNNSSCVAAKLLAAKAVPPTRSVMNSLREIILEFLEL